jgi:hypothetical protein
VKRGIALIAIVAVIILAISARFFDAGTLVFIAGTMLIVAFFAASTVLLGVLSRRAGAGGAGRPPESEERAEVIRDTDDS